jgi:hypothetical protein
MKFGPGTLKIGATAEEIDISCLISGAVISSDKDEGDSRTALCGTVRAGSTTYSWTLAGNMDIDPEDPDGIFMLSQTAYGTEQPFVFTPNTAGAVTATGVLILDPLDFGDGDDDGFGTEMTSDFEFTLIGAPVYSPTIPVGDALDALYEKAAYRGPVKQQVDLAGKPATKAPKASPKADTAA